MVDSFADARHQSKLASDGRNSTGQLDAMGALVYLSKLPFVDRKRIAVVGYSQGGTARAARSHPYQPVKLFDCRGRLKFKAAVAYYPICSAAADELAIPTLILIGELDDWSLAAECRAS